MRGLLCQSFTLSLQQIMTSLSSLQLSLHQSQRLPGWEDSFSVLFEGQHKLPGAELRLSYSGSRHLESIS
jgi:hypothetical protein